MEAAYSIGRSSKRDQERGGSAASASHYFSRNTMRVANAYRDVRWRRLACQSGIALLLMSAALAPAGGNLAVLLWLGGLGLAACTAYTSVMKLLDAARRH
ncbi:hypothetical protein V0U79_10310 [Hyphobacterium sp. HN65]|uniref:Uncharacterized protein n=2 Tax=Hyphobacterium lacteum TaxID=3116575 RepID=A0ABU7LS94_9PROT|nr:hypothetical protein [Hyphobacterium sp. HN65]